MKTPIDHPNRIREFRQARGMYLQNLADRVGCGVTLLSDLERGKRQLTQHWMERISKALRVKVADLYNDKDGGSGVTIEETTLLERFRSASPEQRQLITELVDVALKSKNRATKT